MASGPDSGSTSRKGNFTVPACSDFNWFLLSKLLMATSLLINSWNRFFLAAKLASSFFWSHRLLPLSFGAHFFQFWGSCPLLCLVKDDYLVHWSTPSSRIFLRPLLLSVRSVHHKPSSWHSAPLWPSFSYSSCSRDLTVLPGKLASKLPSFIKASATSLYEVWRFWYTMSLTLTLSTLSPLLHRAPWSSSFL